MPKDVLNYDDDVKDIDSCAYEHLMLYDRTQLENVKHELDTHYL
jgi:hypothetical protein